MICLSGAEASKGVPRQDPDPDARNSRDPVAVTTNFKPKSYQGSNDAHSMLGAKVGLGGDQSSFCSRLVHLSTSHVDLPPVLPSDILVEGKALGPHDAVMGIRSVLPCPSVFNTEVFVVRCISLKAIGVDHAKVEKTKHEFTRAMEQRHRSVQWDKPVATRSAEVQRIIDEKVKKGKRRKSSARRRESRWSLNAQQAGSLVKSTSGNGRGGDGQDNMDEIEANIDVNNIFDDGCDDHRSRGEAHGGPSYVFQYTAHISNRNLLIQSIESIESIKFPAKHEANTTTRTAHICPGSSPSMAVEGIVFGMVTTCKALQRKRLRSATRVILQWSTVIIMMLLMLVMGCNGWEENDRGSDRGVNTTPTLITFISPLVTNAIVIRSLML